MSKLKGREIDGIQLLDKEFVQKALTPKAVEFAVEQLNDDASGDSVIIIKCEGDYAMLKQLINVQKLADELLELEGVQAVIVESWTAPVEGGCHLHILASKHEDFETGRTVSNISHLV